VHVARATTRVSQLGESDLAVAPRKRRRLREGRREPRAQSDDAWRHGAARAWYRCAVSKIEQFLDEYSRAAPALHALAAVLERRLTASVAAHGLEVHFVASRVKDRESLRRKLARPDKTYEALWDVTDLLGLRIATFFEDDIPVVARLIEREQRVDFRHSADKLSAVEPGRFGYRSLHYVCAAPADAGLPAAFRFEIQVRTALQHAWAEVEHDLGYKGGAAIPDVLRRRFSRVASLLEIADQEFVGIRAEIARYRERVLVEVTQAGAPLPLDAITLAAVVDNSVVAALDADIGRRLGRPLSAELWSPDYLVTLCRHAGLRTTQELLDAAAQHQRRALAFVGPYFEYAARTWRFDPQQLDAVPRGYALFFVAHAAILDGEQLGISKVARLAQAYHELDHPGDERTAHRVAGELSELMAQLPTP
jgi:putative GTP pyrophosphokinase